MKRTPLRRSRKRIRPRSLKREALMVQRRALVERILRERPRCEVPSRMAHGRTGLPCGRPGVHLHEKLTRARGGSILDEANCLVACSKCHRLIHDNPEWATEAGLLISQYGRLTDVVGSDLAVRQAPSHPAYPRVADRVVGGGSA